MKSGFSLVEVIVALAITGLIVAAVALFATRGFTIPRQLFEQTQIVQDALKEMERISHDIRNATQVNGQWLIAGAPYSMEIWTKVGDDPTPRQVKYELIGTELFRTVTVPGEESETVKILTSLHQEGVPLFEYRLGGAADKVVLTMVVDRQVGSYPHAATFRREPVVPRAVVYGDPPTTPDPTASPSPSGSLTPTASPTPGSSPTPTASPLPSGSPTPTASPLPGSSPTPTASGVPTPSPGGLPSPLPSPPPFGCVPGTTCPNGLVCPGNGICPYPVCPVPPGA